MPLPKPKIAPYRCRHHYWTSWRHYGSKMWDSGCRLKEEDQHCDCLDAANCPKYKPKDSEESSGSSQVNEQS